MCKEAIENIHEVGSYVTSGSQWTDQCTINVSTAYFMVTAIIKAVLKRPEADAPYTLWSTGRRLITCSVITEANTNRKTPVT